MKLEKGSGKVSHPSHLFIRIRTKLTLNPDGRLENLFIALKLATPDDANETAVRKSDDRKRALLLHYIKTYDIYEHRGEKQNQHTLQ